MKLPVNPAKIRPPSLPKVLVRKRLIEKVEENRDKRIVLILGQAAQGKSTLAASCVDLLNVPFAWINLASDDSDPVNLFYTLVCSLYSVVGEEEFLSLLGHPALDLGSRELMPLYREWAGAIVEHLTSPFMIVLDGLDQLPRESPSLNFLKVFVESVHAPVRLLITSREYPPFQIERLRIRQEVLVLGNDELAFNQKEVELFFREIRKIQLSARAYRKLHKATEGWIGGLVLISHLIERVDPAIREVFIAEEIPPVFKGHVFKYFGEEIFSSQLPRVQNFLVMSSIFDTIEPGIMDLLLEIDDSNAILQQCAQRNLFVQTSHLDKKGTVYRYHPLFKDFLKLKFKTDFDAASRKDIYFRAGSVCEKTGDLENAIKFYLRARAFPEAAALIEIVGMNLVNLGRRGNLEKWLSLLPSNLTQESPWLLLYRCMTRRFSHSDENTNDLRKALKLFEATGDTRGQLLCLALLLEALFLRGHDMEETDELIAKAEKYVENLPRDSYLYEKAMLLLQLPYGYTTRLGEQRKALWAGETAYLLSTQLGILPLQIAALLQLVMGSVFLGEFSKADEYYRSLERTIARCPHPEFTGLQQIHFAHLSLWKGELENAKKAVALAKALTAKHGLIYLYPITVLYELALSFFLEDHDSAKETGRRFLHITRSIGSVFLETVGNLFLGASYYRNGEYEKARDLVEGALEVFSSDGVRSIEHFYEGSILLGYIAYHLGLDGNYVKIVEKALKYFTQLPNPLFVADANFALALLNMKQGKSDAAAQHLAEGFEIAEERGYCFFIEVSRNDLVEVCLLAIKLDVKEAMPYATYLLTTHLGSVAKKRLKELTRDRSLKLRKKAKELYAVIHRADLPRIHIRTLGEFSIRKGSYEISKDKWKGKQPQKLLKALIASGAQGVRKEILCEDLWPDSTPRSVERTFKVALHRLRTSLEPEVDPVVGFCYVQMKGNKVSLDEELCVVDVDEFLRFARRGFREEGNGNEKKALSFYDKAIAIYGGDFLPDDIYSPWAEMKREELRRKYTDVLSRAARICEKRGSSRKAIDYYQRIIDTDPLCEMAYRKLMVLYSNRGEKNEAIRVYHRCAEALQNGLGMKPSKITTSIYKKLLE